MSKETLNQEFKLKKNNEIINYLIEETNRNELMSKKYKKVSRVLNYVSHFFGWYSYRNYKFCNWIKKLGNNCRN